MLALIVVVIGTWIAAAVVMRGIARYWWASRTYGPDLGAIDMIDTVMTPGLWWAGGISILLIVAGFGGLP